MFPITLGRFLVGTAILGIVGIMATVINVGMEPEAEMRIEPVTGVSVLGQPLYVTLVVESSLPDSSAG